MLRRALGISCALLLALAASAQEEAPPDAEEIIRSLELTPLQSAPALDAASLSAISSTNRPSTTRSSVSSSSPRSSRESRNGYCEI